MSGEVNKTSDETFRWCPRRVKLSTAGISIFSCSRITLKDRKGFIQAVLSFLSFILPRLNSYQEEELSNCRIGISLAVPRGFIKHQSAEIGVPRFVAKAQSAKCRDSATPLG